MKVYFRTSKEFLVKINEDTWERNTDVGKVRVLANLIDDNGVKISRRYESRTITPEEVTIEFIQNFHNEVVDLYTNRDLRTLKQKIQDDETTK